MRREAAPAGARAWQAVADLFGGADPAADAPEACTEALTGAGAPPALVARWTATEPARRETEYVRLFVNAMPELPCPPYASVYLEGGLYGDTTGQVRALYRRWGVDTDEVPDHFAVEAAFMAGMVAAGEDGHERDRDWLRDHLRDWAPAFLARVEEADRTGVYAEAARWAARLLAEDGPPR